MIDDVPQLRLVKVAHSSQQLFVLTLRAGMRRFHSWQVIVFGGYFVLLSINYAPLLLHAVVAVEAGWGTLISTVIHRPAELLPALGGLFGSGLF